MALPNDSGKWKVINTFILFDDAAGGMNKQAMSLSTDKRHLSK